MKFFLIKDAKNRLQDQPDRVINISEFRQLVEKDLDLSWGTDPRGISTVENSDGSISKIHPYEGFFVKIADNKFVVCYEYYQGIAIHSPDNEDCIMKCRQLAEGLRAKLFKV